MSILNQIKISFLNLISHKRTTLSIVLNLTFITTLVTCFFAYFFALKDELNGEISGSLSCNYIQTYDMAQYEGLDQLFESENMIQYEIIEFNSSVQDVDISLEIHGERFYSTGETDINVLNMTDSQVCFSINENKEMSTKFGKQIIKQGRCPTNLNEIVFSQNILDCFGLSISDVFGKEVSIWINSDEFLSNVKVVGEIDNDYYSLKENENSNKLSLIVNFSNNVNVESTLIYSYKCKKLFISDYGNASYILQEVSKIYDSSDYFYNAYQYLEVYEELATQIILVKKIFSLIGGVLVFAVFVALFITMKHNITKKRGYHGTLKALGMQNLDVYCIIFFEMIISLCIAVLFSSILSISIMFLLSIILPIVLLVTLKVNILNTFIILGITFTVELLILFLIALFIGLYSKKSSISDQIRCR